MAKKLPNGLNPTIFSEELISSIPEDEYKELCAAYKKTEKLFSRDPELWRNIIIGALIFIAYIIYLILNPDQQKLSE